MLVHPSAMDRSSRTLRYPTVRRREIGTRWRRLTVDRQALLAPTTLSEGTRHERAVLTDPFGLLLCASPAWSGATQ